MWAQVPETGRESQNHRQIQGLGAWKLEPKPGKKDPGYTGILTGTFSLTAQTADGESWVQGRERESIF